MSQIYIIGAGAVGLLVASYISEQHKHVTIVTKRAQQAHLLNEAGLTRIEQNGEHRKLTVSATTLEEVEFPQNAIILIATKYAQLEEVLRKVIHFPHAALLFMQNGLAHYEDAKNLPQQHIAFSSAQFGAERVNDTTVYHRGIGVLKIARERGADEVVRFMRHCRTAQFLVEEAQDAYAMLFEKALLNCFVNPLTALLRVKNGELIKNEYAYHLLKQLYEELMTAFPQMRATFPFQSVYELCERTAENTSSMLADILANRQTEVETIVTPILSAAAKEGLQLPTLEMLYYLVLAVEKSGEKG